MKSSKKLKITNTVRSIGPKLKVMLLNSIQDYKLNSNYIDFICPDPKKKDFNSTEQLNAIVREALIKEFSPEIQNKKSFNLMVEAVVHNLKKKAVAE